MGATRGTASFDNLTPQLVQVVEEWASKSDDDLLEGMRDTEVRVPLTEGRGWREDSSVPKPRPTRESVQAEVDALEKTGLLERICTSYCESRDRFSGDSVTMACVVLDSLIVLQIHLPFPLATFAVYAARNGLMDSVCKCPKPAW